MLMADSHFCIAKPTQHCKAIILQLKIKKVLFKCSPKASLPLLFLLLHRYSKAWYGWLVSCHLQQLVRI